LGSSVSAAELESNSKSNFAVSSKQHPLLAVVESPINRFCDDFASSLVHETHARNAKQSPSFPSTETDDIEGYTVIRRIGDGAEAAVFEAIKDGTTESIALKRYKKVNNMKDGIPMEVEIAKLLNHPNCVRIIDNFRSPMGDFIVAMPLAKEGSLLSSQQPEITPNEAIQLLFEIGSALQHMHSQGVVHRDIKPQNILIFDDCFALCDYSVSTVLKQDEMISGYTGSPIFMAPEVSPVLYKPKPPDMWSLGVSVYALLFGKYPYDLERGLQQVEQNYVKNVARSLDLGELKFPDVPVVPQELKDILAALLIKNPDKRLTADQLVSIEWMKNALHKWREQFKFLSGSVPQQTTSLDM
jgi:serine/threonine protein kinase